MQSSNLQDCINRGLGSAARAIGVACDAYRPAGVAAPLASANRFMRLNAAFNAQDMRFTRAGLPEDAVWYCVCDAAYLLPGDYLVERPGGRTWFIAALQNLLPPLCVLTNHTVSISRPAAAASPGIGPYGGGGAPTPILTGFPASLLHARNAADAPLPADTRPGGGTALLPCSGTVAIARGDLLSDETGRSFVVSGAELNEAGWRLDLRRAAS